MENFVYNCLTTIFKGGTMRGVEYTARERLKAIKLWKEEGHDILWVAHKMKCTIQSLYRWLRKYDGTIESLKTGDKTPHRTCGFSA